MNNRNFLIYLSFVAMFCFTMIIHGFYTIYSNQGNFFISAFTVTLQASMLTIVIYLIIQTWRKNSK